MIRCATKSDILDIIKLEQEAFKKSLGKDFLTQEINDNPLAKYYVLEKNKQIIGYIGFRLDENKAEMMNFVVSSKFQNQGYGKKLLENALNDLIHLGAKSMILEVRESNHGAKHVYESLGFKPRYIRKKYYENEDAIVYIKEVSYENISC